MHSPAILALADGSVFYGESIGADGQTIGEVVFNTAMTGYQEILTDPSYAKQIVTLTYPHIGNTGTTPEDKESNQVWAAGLIIRDLPLLASNWRSKQSLPEYLKENNVIAIAEIDTRRLTRLLREKGSQNGCILTGKEATAEKAIALAKGFPGLEGMDLAKVVSTKVVYDWNTSIWHLETDSCSTLSAEQLPYHVVAFDYGVKHNILRMLTERGCRVTVLPATSSLDEALAYNPDGIFLTNGPGDPAACDYAIETIKQLINKHDLPVFGICLGHQLLALASGAKTVKMPHGHHGANHPVQDLETGMVMITSQNHGFAVDEKTLPAFVRATHKSLFDKTLQGIELVDRPIFSFQGHPEASPGPHDVAPLFDRFVESMANNR